MIGLTHAKYNRAPRPMESRQGTFSALGTLSCRLDTWKALWLYPTAIFSYYVMHASVLLPSLLPSQKFLFFSKLRVGKDRFAKSSSKSC